MQKNAEKIKKTLKYKRKYCIIVKSCRNMTEEFNTLSHRVSGAFGLLLWNEVVEG